MLSDVLEYGSSDRIQAHQDAVNLIYENRMSEIPPSYIISCIPSTGTAYFAKEAGLKGPSFSISSACSTSNHAFGQAYTFIKSGVADDPKHQNKPVTAPDSQ